MEKTAIVILNYNGRHYLEKFLPGVIQYSPYCSIYVADNYSSDDSIPFLKKHFPEVNLIELDKNYGFSGGYNQCLKRIKSEYYILLNSDVEVTPGWIDPIISLMDSNPEIGACQPKLIEYRRKDYFEYAGAAGGWIDRYGYPFCRGRVFRTMERDFGQYDDIAEIFWASGACFCIRSELFHDLGGFDDDFFAHMEEIDLCWRIQLSGYKVYYTAESTIYHMGGGTLEEKNPFKNYLNFRNSFITLIKNSRRHDLISRIMFRFFMDMIASVRFLLFNSIADFLAVIKADIYIIRNFRYHYRKRKKIKRKNESLTGIYNGSLVFSYYLLHRKYFFNIVSVIPHGVVSSS